MDGVFLDAKPAKNGLELVLATSRGLERVQVRQEFRIYMVPLGGYSGEDIARSLRDNGLSSWVEEWLKPPWYIDKREVVVVSSPSLHVLERVSRILSSKGVARRVNEYPGVLVEALWRLGVPPGTRVRIGGDGISVVEDLRDPLYDPPPLRIAFLEAYSWHGEIAIPWEKPEYYILECCGVREKLGSPRLVLELLGEINPHIIVSRLEVKYTLPPTRRWLWFDKERNLVSIWGLIEWMRVSWLPFHMAAEAPIGKILTAAEAREAYSRRYLVDPSAPRIEPFRLLHDLASSDMAGAARIPEPGVYWDVYQLDYSSLYPSLIGLHNISSETVWRPGCNDYIIAPGVGHRICRSPRGIVSTVLSWLVERRNAIRRMNPRDERIRERIEAIKWILVSGFGYLGYRNSLFGSITAYECVTAFARRALEIAEEEAGKAGYKLVHSIIDSIFIQPVNPSVSISELMDRIVSRVGVPLKLEAYYKWLYIPPTLKGPGAVNKYYGSLVEGGVKVRGIMMVRRDTPPFIAMVQERAIMSLALAEAPEEFPDKVCEAHDLMDKAVEDIVEGRVPLELLAITRKLSYPVRRPYSYRRSLDSKGLILDKIKYITTSRGPKPIWEIDRSTRHDANYYVILLERARRELPPREWCVNKRIPTGTSE